MNNFSDSSLAFQMLFLDFPQIYEGRKSLIIPHITRLAIWHKWKYFRSKKKISAEKEYRR